MLAFYATANQPHVKLASLCGVRNKQHRLDGPAVIMANGDREWWVDGRLHREGAPTRLLKDGLFEGWRVHGDLHREGTPAVIYPNGGREWWEHDECQGTAGIPKAGKSDQLFLEVAMKPCAERREEAE